MAPGGGGLMATLMRRKAVEEDHMSDTSLARVLGLVDLCCLAVGSTLGLGIYVLAGDVAKTEAGPAVVLSFLVAALASLFAALCYAEFAARVPKAGSAYVYSYVCVGEFVAFVIGWNLILEYVIGTASVARGYSTYVDSIFDSAMEKAFTKCCGMDVEFLSAYPDFFALFLVMLLSVLLAIGVRESTRFNNVFTFANLVVVIYVIITGSFKADTANWKIDPEKVPDWDYDTYGTGGFMPFGIGGVMAGAARCFYGFVGFDAVATTGEEAKNPQRTIPLAIIIGLTIIFLSYFGVSAVLTLMWPYYLQDEDAPIPAAFEALGWETARWIVTIGALFGLSSSLLGALFPLPRILYAMANDGLIFRWMANIHPRFHTPFWSTLLAGVFAAGMAAFFDLEQLVDMMSIGTLLAYSLVAVCVLVLRYRDETLGLVDHDADLADGPTLPATASTELLLAKDSQKNIGVLARALNLHRQLNPSHESARLVNHVTMAYGVLVIAFCAVLVFGAQALLDVEVWAVALAALLGTAMLACVLVIQRQPESKAHLFFKVPLVPYLPMLSVFANVYLMMKLGPATWIRFAIWMVLGLAMYFGYGLKNSTAGKGPGSGGGKRRPEHLRLDQLELPTIVIEPATPLNRSPKNSPHMANGRPSAGGDAGGEAEPAPAAAELIVDTTPEELDERPPVEATVETAAAVAVAAVVAVVAGEETDGEKEEKGDTPAPVADALDQERTLVMVTQTVQRQRGLHALIVAALKPDGGDTSRGRQLALTQQQVEENRLERGDEPAPPRPMDVPALSPEFLKMLESAQRQATVQHAAVLRCLGAPEDGSPTPIRVSAEVHAEDSDPTSHHADPELAASGDRVSALLAGGEPDARLKDQLMAEHWRRHEAGTGEETDSPPAPPAVQHGSPPPLPEGFGEHVQRLHDSVTEQMSASPPPPPQEEKSDPLHAAVCECFSRGWIDLGRGAALADSQRAVDAARGPPPPPPVSQPPPPRADPFTPEEKQRLEQMHTAIRDCLSASRTPPNTPTGTARPRPPLAPLALSGGAHKPLQRVISNSSFKNIPPQSPQSPLARRVGDKFVIIPVSGDEDSEREDEPTEREDVKQAIGAVKREVETALARAAGEEDESNEENGDTATDAEKPSEEVKDAEQPSHSKEDEGAEQESPSKEKEGTPGPEVRRAMNAVLAEVAAASGSPEQGRRSASPDEPTPSTPGAGGSSGNDSGDERSAGPTPETRRAMDSVLADLSVAAAARGETREDETAAALGELASAVPDTPTAKEEEAPGPRVGGHDKLTQVAAPPEPNMKDKLDQIIKQAVQKAAKRVSEAPGEEADGGPESPPVVENLGDGMHRVRSRKQKHTPAFDMNELMSRFEKKSS